MRILTLLTLWLLCMVPLHASAQVPTIYAGLVGGYTAAADDTAVDPMGPAIGARAGLTLPMTDIYVGGLFLYHIGEDIAAIGTASSMMMGAELGYEFGLGPITLRPSLGFGLNRTVAELGNDALSVSADSNDFYLSPGIGAMLSLGVLLGAEIRYNAIFEEDYPDGISILGMLGISI